MASVSVVAWAALAAASCDPFPCSDRPTFWATVERRGIGSAQPSVDAAWSAEHGEGARRGWQTLRVSYPWRFDGASSGVTFYRDDAAVPVPSATRDVDEQGGCPRLEAAYDLEALAPGRYTVVHRRDPRLDYYETHEVLFRPYAGAPSLVMVIER